MFKCVETVIVVRITQTVAQIRTTKGTTQGEKAVTHVALVLKN